MSEVSWSIRHCPLAKRCRVRWAKMTPIDGNADIRLCAKCQHEVHLCRTDEELEAHRALGHCVALETILIDYPLVGEPMGMYLERRDGEKRSLA